MRPYFRALMRDIRMTEAEWMRAVTASQITIAKLLAASPEELAKRRKLAKYRIASLEARLARLDHLLSSAS